MPKKPLRKRVSNNVNIKTYASKITKFLGTKNSPYSEAQLVEELFGIPLKTEGYIPKSTEVEQLRSIKEALRLLMDEKKIYAAKLEDPVTNEQVLHYSSSGWFATP